MTGAQSEKVEIRRLVRARRANFVAGLPPAAHHLAFRALPSPLRALLHGRNAVALYLPLGDEAPAARFVDQLRAAGHAVCLPRVLGPNGAMDFRLWAEDDPLEAGPFETRHPADSAPIVAPDVILCPLVAFDRALNRLGQGGGYYDRAFAAYPDALRIGVGWSVQEVDAVPVDPWDVSLDAILTEVELIEGEAR